MAERWDERGHDYRDDRGYRGRERDERGMFERGADEVRSWMGDDEAARRRRMDELRDERHGRESDDRAAKAGERAWESTRSTVRDMTDRDRDGRRGFAEWNDNDRPFDRPRQRDDYWTRERSFGDPARYANADPYVGSRWSAEPTRREWRDTSYIGRGPRGYTRADERIREDVCDRLTEDARIDASDVDVQVKAGEVTLTGSVRTRDEKRFTEDVAERITGVHEVNNNLKVRPPDEVIGTARSGASVLGLSETPPPAKK